MKRHPILSLEEINLGILHLFSEEPVWCERFCELSGLSPHQIRPASQSQDFSTFLLDYVMQEEKLLLKVATHLKCDPALLVEAHVASNRYHAGDH